MHIIATSKKQKIIIIDICGKINSWHTEVNFIYQKALKNHSPVSWDCRIYQLHLCRGIAPISNERPGYDTKLSDGKVPILEHWGMQRILSLPLLSGPLTWSGST